MTAKPKKKLKKKPKNLDSLSFPEVKRLLERIAKSLGFKLFHRVLRYSRKSVWLFIVDNDIVVFLEGNNGCEFQPAKDLLRGILNSRIFKLRHVYSSEEKTIQNPFYSLDLIALLLKLDLLLAT